MYNMKEANYNPMKIIHGMLYAATVTYLRVLRNLLRIGTPSFRKHIEETYHSKVVRLDDARKFITINENIELKNLEQVLPYKHAKDIVLKNPHNVVAYECACRALADTPCQPTNVCLIIGEPFVDLVRMLQPLRSKRITAQEALEILKEEDERGHVHTAWFKTAMLDRFYAICNCCKCCCLGMKHMKQYEMNSVLPSGYIAVSKDDCTGCGECAKNCQFDAIEMVARADNGKKKLAKIIPEKCFGCGICESKCKNDNISLTLDTSKGTPLDIENLAQTAKTVN
jgi:formate hydrogenlyase subunit 6/NADH:ubiquinone oxidoreductase subunit I